MLSAREAYEQQEKQVADEKAANAKKVEAAAQELAQRTNEQDRLMFDAAVQKRAAELADEQKRADLAAAAGDKSAPAPTPAATPAQ